MITSPTALHYLIPRPSSRNARSGPLSICGHILPSFLLLILLRKHLHPLFPNLYPPQGTHPSEQLFRDLEKSTDVVDGVTVKIRDCSCSMHFGHALLADYSTSSSSLGAGARSTCITGLPFDDIQANTSLSSEWHTITLAGVR